jgi:hypothetical protein
MALSIALAIEIIDEICSGASLKQTLLNRKVPIPSFFEYIAANPVLSNRYGRAQLARAELLVEEIVDIADTESDPQKARVRTDVRKWYASKMQPQKYGDRVDINVNQTVDINAALSEAKRRALPSSYQEDVTDGELIETKALTLPRATGSEPVDNPPKEGALENSSIDVFS